MEYEACKEGVNKEKRIKLTVIIPIYHGEQYIPLLLKMMHDNYDRARQQLESFEVIFINDSPEVELEIPVCREEMYSIQLVTNSENRGIHYSRIRGINESTCEYVMFLDQDDKISPNYMRYMISEIGDNDAVVCNGYDAGRVIVRSTSELRENIRNKNKWIAAAKTLFPGQVMIKKESIPTQWLQNVITRNCADDLYLWMLMLSCNASFRVIEKKLYCHVATGFNKSDDLLNKLQSDKEVFSHLINNNDLSLEDIESQYIDLGLDVVDASVLGRLQNQQVMNRVLEGWMANRERDFCISQFLIENGYRRVAIYGLGNLGRHLIYELSKSEIDVVCVIDRNKLSEGFAKIKQPGEDIGEVDCIIVTPVTEYGHIYEQLSMSYSCKIISLETCISLAVVLE